MCVRHYSIFSDDFLLCCMLKMGPSNGSIGRFLYLNTAFKFLKLYIFVVLINIIS